jgi:hypothetical protein
MIRRVGIIGSILSLGRILLRVLLILVCTAVGREKMLMSLGSGDLWVADRQGGYQASQSSTYHLVNSSWEIRYDSNVGAYVFLKVSLMHDRSGNWGTEDVTLPGGLVMEDVLFGDATSPGQGSGFMGVRYLLPLTRRC